MPASRPTGVYHLPSRRCMLVGDVSSTKIRRTNINLNTELVEAAAAVLGTARTTDTVHAALRAVIDRAARERLAERDFADLTSDVLDQVRRPRQFE
jgi:Arc/MetJ family transcription regulator